RPPRRRHRSGGRRAPPRPGTGGGPAGKGGTSWQALHLCGTLEVYPAWRGVVNRGRKLRTTDQAGGTAMPPQTAGASVTLDVLGLGCVAGDDLLYVAAYPPADAKVQVRRRERQCGGLTGTALVAAARLGSRCAYAGVLGEDEDSRFVVDCLRREGI